MCTEAQFLQPQEVDQLPSKKADTIVQYGEDELQFAELRLPKGEGPFPVIIVVHGGCWYSPYADLKNTAAIADALRDEGYATYNVEYRRFDNAGGGWPNTILDVGKAIDYLRILAPKFNLDLNKVVSYGHSAGGHLAFWLGTRNQRIEGDDLYIENPLPIKGIVGVGSINDLVEFEKIDTSTCGEVVVVKLMGGKVEVQPKRYQEASPILNLPLGTPQILITGESDNIVPSYLGEAYTKAAKEAGDNVKHIVVKDAAHHEYNAPEKPPYQHILNAVEELME
jgi:acetyl esterase/lipase